MNRYLAGAVGGLLATVPMTLVMEALYRRLPREERYPLPPREITQDIVLRAEPNAPLDDEQYAKLSLASHFGYGALAGAFYPVACRDTTQPLLHGSGYGVAVWAASYFGWIPALRILAPPQRHPTSRRRLMIVAHLVWGAGAVWIGERLAQSHNDNLNDGRTGSRLDAFRELPHAARSRADGSVVPKRKTATRHDP